MAYVAMAYTVMAYVVVAYIAMHCIVMAYIGMACIIMAQPVVLWSRQLWPYRSTHVHRYHVHSPCQIILGTVSYT